NRRSNTALNSELETIPGIGKQSVESLLQYFKSVKRIKEANLEQLSSVLGVSRAKKVQAYFLKKE
ncbi:helix-hairpin-helix domain-containing protein, partial [Saccharophagus degradans]